MTFRGKTAMAADGETTLLAAGRAGAGARAAGAAAPSDFLLTADHAGRMIPRRLGRLGVPESELGRHIAWDIGIAGVTERLVGRAGCHRRCCRPIRGW